MIQRLLSSRRMFPALAAVAVVLAPAAVLAPSHAAPADAPAWTVVSPGGDTGCAFETPFRFFVHEGRDASRLLVWFQGGGACWNFTSCAGMFDRSVDEGELDSYGGIFDFSSPENPFADYSVVFVPYCTGDVHVGDATLSYGDSSWNAPAVRHLGWKNVDAVLAWMRANLEAPERLVVSGASAGSYGALFHAPRIADLYPDAALVMIGDSGVPLLKDYPAILQRWGASDRIREAWGVSDATRPVTLEAAHEVLAERRPDAAIAQLTSNDDHVQGAFYLISGSPAWRADTFGLLGELEVRVPGFRAFVVAGAAHGLLRDDAFYEREAGGASLREWIADLIAGRSVASRFCEECVLETESEGAPRG